MSETVSEAIEQVVRREMEQGYGPIGVTVAVVQALGVNGSVGVHELQRALAIVEWLDGCGINERGEVLHQAQNANVCDFRTTKAGALLVRAIIAGGIAGGILADRKGPTGDEMRAVSEANRHEHLNMGAHLALLEAASVLDQIAKRERYRHDVAVFERRIAIDPSSALSIAGREARKAASEPWAHPGRQQHCGPGCTDRDHPENAPPGRPAYRPASQE